MAATAAPSSAEGVMRAGLTEPISAKKGAGGVRACATARRERPPFLELRR
jgi:hypothetical protein